MDELILLSEAAKGALQIILLYDFYETLNKQEQKEPLKKIEE